MAKNKDKSFTLDDKPTEAVYKVGKKPEQLVDSKTDTPNPPETPAQK